MTTNNGVPNWRDSAYELCAWAASRSIPMTPAMMQCMMLATGDGKEHPNPIDELARAALSDTSQPAMPADAEIAEILREAAAIISGILPENAPGNIRWPIIDELEGFALMFDHARRVEGEGE